MSSRAVRRLRAQAKRELASIRDGRELRDIRDVAGDKQLAQSLGSYSGLTANVTGQNSSQNMVPDITQVRDSAPSYREEGAPGTAIFNGIIYGEDYNPDFSWREGVRIYDQMRLNDYQVNASLMMGDLPIRAGQWKVQPASDAPVHMDHAAFMETALFHELDQPFDDVLRHAILAKAYGFMVMEIVWKKGKDGMIYFQKFAPRMPKTIWRWWIDESNELLGVQQWTFKQYTYQYLDIPSSKLLVFTYRQEGNNFEGRALALDTPIPSPDGWTTMGALGEGDRVFDEKGRIRHVTATADWQDRPVYEVVFSDGETIVADAAHQWQVNSRRHGNRSVVLTTEEMARLGTGYNGDRVRAFSIPNAEPLQYAPQYLPIDPYVFGYWLGDGVTKAGEIITNDEPVLRELATAGYVTRAKGDRAYSVQSKDGPWQRGGLSRELNSLGVLGHKHIPAAYRYASVAQRVALLQGLMDSDGTAGKAGQCEFTNTDQALVEQVAEVVRSLGCRVTIGERAPSEGPIKGTKTVYRLRFTPSFAPFRLARKIATLPAMGPRRSGKRSIVAIRPAGTRATKCIEVDSPSHLFLAGRGAIPTHNSVLRTAYKPWFYKDVLMRIMGIGFEREHVGIPVFKLPQGYTAADLTRAQNMGKNMRSNSQAYITIPNTWEVEWMSGKQGRSSSHTPILDAISLMDVAIARNVLMQEMNLGSTETGSYALADAQTDISMMTLQADANGIAQTFNNKRIGAIPQLIRMNIAQGLLDDGGDMYPQLTCHRIQNFNIMDAASALANLARFGIITPTPEIEDYVRDAMGFPTAPRNVIEATKIGAAQLQSGVNPQTGEPLNPHELQLQREQMQQQADLARQGLDTQVDMQKRDQRHQIQTINKTQRHDMDKTKFQTKAQAAAAKAQDGPGGKADPQGLDKKRSKGPGQDATITTSEIVPEQYRTERYYLMSTAHRQAYARLIRERARPYSIMSPEEFEAAKQLAERNRKLPQDPDFARRVDVTKRRLKRSYRDLESTLVGGR